jgi:hypothetical protein
VIYFCGLVVMPFEGQKEKSEHHMFAFCGVLVTCNEFLVLSLLTYFALVNEPSFYRYNKQHQYIVQKQV